MNCTQVSQRVDRWLDDELSVESRRNVDQHLQQCESCRRLFSERREEHRRWFSVFQPERASAEQVADRIVERISVPTVNASRRRSSVWSLLAAMAAGFLLALIVFPPWRKTDPIAVPPPVAAQLSLVSGEVELSHDQAITWMKCPEPIRIDDAVRLRTDASSLCEVRSDDGTVVRLNTETDVNIARPNEVELQQGQIWCQTEQPSGLRIKTTQTDVVVDGACDVVSRPEETKIVVCEGQTTVHGPDWHATLEAGQSVRVVDGQPDDTVRVDPLLATRWVHHLLSLRSVTDPETTRRTEQLWSAVGRAKLDYLYEEELRILGSQCCVPLLAYLNSDDSRGDPVKRVKAARIVADVANHALAPDLIHLLADDEADVRFHAARGLERLTGQNFGLSCADWQVNFPESCGPALNRWQKWLETNQARFPKSAIAKSPPSVRKKKG